MHDALKKRGESRLAAHNDGRQNRLLASLLLSSASRGLWEVIARSDMSQPFPLMCRSEWESSLGLMGWTLDAYQKTLGRRSEAVCRCRLFFAQVCRHKQRDMTQFEETKRQNNRKQ